MIERQIAVFYKKYIFISAFSADTVTFVVVNAECPEINHISVKQCGGQVSLTCVREKCNYHLACIFGAL